MMWLQEPTFGCRIIIIVVQISCLPFCRHLYLVLKSRSFGAAFTGDFFASSHKKISEPCLTNSFITIRET